MTACLPLIKNVLTPLAKSILLPLRLSGGMPAADEAIQKTVLIVSNEVSFEKWKI